MTDVIIGVIIGRQLFKVLHVEHWYLDDFTTAVQQPAVDFMHFVAGQNADIRGKRGPSG